MTTVGQRAAADDRRSIAFHAAIDTLSALDGQERVDASDIFNRARCLPMEAVDAIAQTPSQIGSLSREEVRPLHPRLNATPTRSLQMASARQIAAASVIGGMWHAWRG